MIQHADDMHAYQRHQGLAEMLVKVSDEWCLAFAIFLLRPWSRDHSVQVQLEGIIMTQDAKVPNSRQPTDSLPQLARRRILRSASGLASALALSSFFAPYGAIAKKKKTQAEVEYQQTPKGKEKCENCSFWVKPNQCTNVEGPIVAEGWCNIWISAD